VGVGDILVGAGSARWHFDLVLDPQRGCCSHQKGSLYHEERLAAKAQNEKLAGKVQKTVGQIEKVFEK
jgi:hypothetical protein